MQALEVRRRLLDQLAHFETAMLCTRASNGELRARPMQLAQIQGNGDLWFVTGIGTGKVEEVLNDPAVLITFQSRTHFVSVSGRAEVVGDELLIESLWRDKWQAFFPQGKNDPRLVLIHVRATEAEYWDESQNRTVRHAFEVAKAALNGHRADEVEEHAHLML